MGSSSRPTTLVQRLVSICEPEVVPFLIERERKGYEKYGVPLTSSTYDDPEFEAIEELLDAMIYLFTAGNYIDALKVQDLIKQILSARKNRCTES